VLIRLVRHFEALTSISILVNYESEFCLPLFLIPYLKGLSLNNKSLTNYFYFMWFVITLLYKRAGIASAERRKSRQKKIDIFFPFSPLNGFC